MSKSLKDKIIAGYEIADSESLRIDGLFCLVKDIKRAMKRDEMELNELEEFFIHDLASGEISPEYIKAHFNIYRKQRRKNFGVWKK